MKKVIQTPKAPAPVGPYSQAVQFGDLLFCSGQISIRPDTNEVILGDVQSQTRQVMENVRSVLQEAGLNFANVLKTTIFLTNMGDFPKVNEVYAEYFKEGFPARSTVAVSGLPKGVSVEIEVVAHR